MTKHVGLCPIIRMVNTSFIFGSATLENGCWNKQIPKVFEEEEEDNWIRKSGWRLQRKGVGGVYGTGELFVG